MLSLIEVIQAALAPVILITAIGLINISLYNRYGRIHDRIRHLLHDIDALTLAQVAEEVRNRKIANAKKQIELLLERGRFAKWALFLMQFALVAVVVDAVLIFVNILEIAQLALVIIAVFGISMLLILVSAILVAIEISKSLRHLEFEIQTVIKE
ncbi:MAG: DUF2721 domain-containing protein [Candidatus Bathyarchaeia archaeon]